MDTAVWIVQGLVAVLFGMAGFTKLTQEREKLLQMMPWVEDFSASQVKGIGFLEALGGLGVILPALTGILPWLSAVAGVGLMLVMTGAALTHTRRKEYSVILVNLLLFSLAAFVAYGRFIAEPL